jgi:hypothetical protein
MIAIEFVKFGVFAIAHPPALVWDLSEAYATERCNWSKEWAFVATLFCTPFAELAAGVFLLVKNWHVPSRWNESRGIAVSGTLDALYRSLFILDVHISISVCLSVSDSLPIHLLLSVQPGLHLRHSHPALHRWRHVC